MAIATNNAPRVIEVRVITHVPNPPAAAVAIIFSNGTSSACEQEFPNAEAAEHFAAGLRAGLDWQARIISESIVAAQKFQDQYAMQPLDATDFVEMIERDFIERPNGEGKGRA